MEEMSMFQSQLSSIMEKLVLSAVTEINQIMCEYCAVLRSELSLEKQDNCTLREKLKQHRPVDGFMRDSRDGNSGSGPQLQADQKNSKETAEEQEERTLSSVDCKFKPITFKCEEVPEGQPNVRVAPPLHLTSCSQVGERCAHAARQSSQFCNEPPEASQDPTHTDYNPSLEMECRLSLSPSGAQFTDLGFHVKRELESPDLQIQGEDANLGFELQQGILCQMYTESGAFPLGSTLLDTQTPTCLTSLQPEEDQHMLRTYNMTDLSSNGQHAADGETSSHQFEKRRTVQYRTPGRFKCDYCGKGFPFLSMMKGHRLSHTGERNQVCGQCGMTFIRRSHLKRHEMLHMGVKPFICQVCGRTFSRSAHLSSHMKTHNM